MSTGYGMFKDQRSGIDFYWDASQMRRTISLCGTNDMDVRLRLDSEVDIVDMYQNLQMAMRHIGMEDQL